jgi:hypothetical protein
MNDFMRVSNHPLRVATDSRTVVVSAAQLDHDVHGRAGHGPGIAAPGLCVTLCVTLCMPLGVT